MPDVVAAHTGADLLEVWATPMPCAWSVTEDMLNPPHFPVAVDSVNYVGDAVAVVLARSETAAHDALEAIVVDYDPLPAVIDLEEALADKILVHADLGHQHVVPLGAGHRRRGRRRRVRVGGLHRQGALRPAAPPADGDGAARLRGGAPALRRRPHALLRHADPAHPQDHGGAHPRRPRAPVARRGPVGRRGLRLEARRLCRGAALRSPRLQASGAGALGRGAHRERAGHDPGPRPDPGHRAGGRRRRQAHRGAGRAHRRHGRLPAADHARHPPARGVPLRRRLRPARGVRLRVHRRVHHDDAHRRLPRRRPTRGHLCHRAGHGSPCRVTGHRPGRAAAPQLRQGRAVPVHRHDRSRLRLGRPRGGAGQGARAWSATTTCGPSSNVAGRADDEGPPGHRHLVLLRDVRARPVPRAGFAQLHRRRMGVRHRAHHAHQQGAGHHRHRRLTARATRRRGR